MKVDEVCPYCEHYADWHRLRPFSDVYVCSCGCEVKLTKDDTLVLSHPGRPQTLSERHQAHYQSCNCLADSAICCLPACPCKQTDPGRSPEGS